MKNKQTILSIALCLLPIILGIVLWDKLPEQIAVHFNETGTPDNYAPKAFAVFGIPIFMAIIDAIVIFSIHKDPKAERHTKFMEQLSTWMCPVISNIVMTITLFIAMGKDVPISIIISSMIGLLIALIGNYLPKCKQNYTIGIKLPWTLNSEDNWNYTHRIGGFVWVIGGILLIINGFVQIPYINLIVFGLIIGIPVFSSYQFYLKE